MDDLRNEFTSGSVIPAKAGIQAKTCSTTLGYRLSPVWRTLSATWIPACAGMTNQE